MQVVIFSSLVRGCRIWWARRSRGRRFRVGRVGDRSVIWHVVARVVRHALGRRTPRRPALQRPRGARHAVPRRSLRRPAPSLGALRETPPAPPRARAHRARSRPLERLPPRSSTVGASPARPCAASAQAAERYRSRTPPAAPITVCAGAQRPATAAESTQRSAAPCGRSRPPADGSTYRPPHRRPSYIAPPIACAARPWPRRGAAEVIWPAAAPRGDGNRQRRHGTSTGAHAARTRRAGHAPRISAAATVPGLRRRAAPCISDAAAVPGLRRRAAPSRPDATVRLRHPARHARMGPRPQSPRARSGPQGPVPSRTRPHGQRHGHDHRHRARLGAIRPGLVVRTVRHRGLHAHSAGRLGHRPRAGRRHQVLSPHQGRMRPPPPPQRAAQGGGATPPGTRPPRHARQGLRFPDPSARIGLPPCAAHPWHPRAGRRLQRPRCHIHLRGWPHAECIFAGRPRAGVRLHAEAPWVVHLPTRAHSPRALGRGP